jgi:PKD repeat protein
MRKRIIFWIVFLTTILSHDILVYSETKYQISGVAYHKDSSTASGIHIEVLEGDQVIKTSKTDGSGKYKFDVELLESHKYLIRASKKSYQTFTEEFETPDSTQTQITLDIVVNRLPVIKINGPYEGFINEPVLFSSAGSYDPDGDSLSYLWSFGDGKTSELENPSYHYDKPDEYTVSLIITDIEDGSSQEITKCTIENRPPVSIPNGPYEGKEGSLVVFSSNGSFDPDGGSLSYLWDFGDNSQSFDGSPSHAYSEKGDYSVSLTVIDEYGLEDKQSTKCVVIENQSPISKANGPYTAHLGESIQFDSSGSYDPDGEIIEYLWVFGDDGISTEVFPTHEYMELGVFSVTLTVTDDNGEMDTDEIECEVLEPPPRPPIVEANGPYSAFLGREVRFDSMGTYDPDGSISEYLWDFGDGSLSRESNPVHIYGAVGNYIVSLTVLDDDGFEVADSTTCEIKKKTTSNPSSPATPQPTNIEPIASGNGPYQGITGETISFLSKGSFDPDGEIKSYLWIFGDGTQSTRKNPSHIYQEPGIYYITLRVIDDEGKKDEYETICEVKDPNFSPIVKINGPYSSKINIEIQFNSSGSFDPDGDTMEYLWEFGDGTSSVEVNPVHFYNVPGEYNVSLTLTDEYGESNNKTTLSIIDPNLAPVSKITGPTASKVGQATKFSGKESIDYDGEIVEYIWSYGNKTYENMLNVTHVFSSEGVFQVGLSVRDNDNATNISVMDHSVTVNLPPIVETNGPWVGFVGEEILFDSSNSVDPDGKIVETLWEFGDGARALSVAKTHAYEVPGEYFVKITVNDDSGDESIKSVRVLIVEPERVNNFPVVTVSTVLAVALIFFFRASLTIFLERIGI